ncbi:haloacid dehalogenase type II [Cohaesibacter gelatinilyticus]|uniref:(S)-2-haloacid dehalogenase n=1 Tax=Cohaesibacter gelatinilyticus TaxID=372072 RepID=A0A285NDN9_9HYPH|nr:haloacid dehalogenase type II [Cohaesibacter gelatinilyticus]SNZ07067.1 2-haloacid dehalogenase [Cohaesibacter gelatinilyticus]HAT85214.1 haloacid dehalogenase type II [Hyphomicrobiales bacterium]
MSQLSACSVYVFDAYGTLFDVHAAVRKHEQSLGPNAALLSEIWRNKQLEYSWVRSLMGKYRDFWTLTEEALDYAFAKVPDADMSKRTDLLDAYFALEAYPEVRSVLERLKAQGNELAILSNGSPDMLKAAVEGNGLTDLLDHVLSVDELRTYKTAEAVYELVGTVFRAFPEAVSFQSSNRWDIAGATAYGFRTVWINRTGQPDEYGDLSPAAQLKDLEGLLLL